VRQSNDTGVIEPANGIRTQRERLIAYYEGAALDFGEWSRGFNMHFGYYRRGLNPFAREAMLNEMNRQVLQRLRLAPDAPGLIVDLGCGVGATVRCAASMFPRKRILGMTIVPWQVETGNAWNRRVGLRARATLCLADYTATGLAAASADGAVAIESACHAEGTGKEPFVREAARIVRPGARLVVADAFRRGGDRPLDPVSGRLHDVLCRTFVLPGLAHIDAFVEALERHGFTDVLVEDASWRVAPSVLQAPIAVIWFALKKAARREPLREERVNNLKGSFVSALLGANRFRFGYYLVSARRREGSEQE
jgi:SAM-dependent methyltransferase